MLSDHILLLAEGMIETFENKYSKFSETFALSYSWIDCFAEASYHKLGHCISATIRAYIKVSLIYIHSLWLNRLYTNSCYLFAHFTEVKIFYSLIRNFDYIIFIWFYKLKKIEFKLGGGGSTCL